MDMDHILNGPGLLFRSFTGHHIEFRTGSLNPIEHMTLNCEGLSHSYLLSQTYTFLYLQVGVH